MKLRKYKNLSDADNKKIDSKTERMKQKVQKNAY